jgi:hypothetical protein
MKRDVIAGAGSSAIAARSARSDRGEHDNVDLIWRHRSTTNECAMTTNVDRIDRVLRIVAGLAIVSLFFFQDYPDRWWILVWLIPLWAALIRLRTVYPPIGTRTRRIVAPLETTPRLDDFS